MAHIIPPTDTPGQPPADPGLTRLYLNCRDNQGGRQMPTAEVWAGIQSGKWEPQARKARELIKDGGKSSAYRDYKELMVPAYTPAGVIGRPRGESGAGPADACLCRNGRLHRPGRTSGAGGVLPFAVGHRPALRGAGGRPDAGAIPAGMGSSLRRPGPDRRRRPVGKRPQPPGYRQLRPGRLYQPGSGAAPGELGRSGTPTGTDTPDTGAAALGRG